MTAKEYLSQAYYVDKRINSKLRQVESLRDLATKVTSALGSEPVSGSRNIHRTEDTLDKIIDLQNDINDDVDRLIDLKREVMKLINKMEDADCLTILELRYLSFMSWEQIATEMNFSYRWVHTLHARALKAFEKIFKECTLNHCSSLSRVL